MFMHKKLHLELSTYFQIFFNCDENKMLVGLTSLPSQLSTLLQTATLLYGI